MYLVCCCISIINPQSHCESQTSSAKVSERSRASAISDDSCFYGAQSRFSHHSSSSSIILHSVSNRQNISLDHSYLTCSIAADEITRTHTFRCSYVELKVPTKPTTWHYLLPRSFTRLVTNVAV